MPVCASLAAMEVLLIVAALVVIVALVILLLRTRDRGPPDTSAPLGEDLVPVADEADEELLVVPLPGSTNEALVLGSAESVMLFEQSGLATRATRPDSGPLPQVVRSVMGVGGSEATRRANTQIDQGRIVALSEQTMRDLKDGKHAFDKSGQMLAQVRNKKGHLKPMRLDQAGAKALTASNAATLAMTAAVSQQLAEIQEQLEDIKSTLDGLIKDADRHRLAKVIAANNELRAIANAASTRGELTESDQYRIAAMKLSVEENSVEAELKFEELLHDLPEDLGRAQRVERLEEVLGRERLEYWLSVRVGTELAKTRWDALNLYSEQISNPQHAAELAEHARQELEARRARLREIGTTLDAFADPEARSRIDRVRLLSARRLKRWDQTVATVLEQHGDVFR